MPEEEYLQRPFFQNNIYFRYYTSLFKLNTQSTRYEGLKELNETVEYRSIDGIDKILDIVNNYEKMNQVWEVSKKGIILYGVDGGLYRANLLGNHTPKITEQYDIYLASNSNNRSYYYGVFHWNEGTPEKSMILNSSFEMIKGIGHFPFYQVNDIWNYNHVRYLYLRDR